MAYNGSCACGAVRYEATREPRRVSVCHCKDCQRRTGSTFGLACYFPRESVRLLSGTTKTFERTSDAARRVRLQFCETCGTTVLWHAEVVPDLVGVAAGTLDDTGWLAPKLHVWARSAQGWLRFPEDAEVLERSNFGQPE
jgi:hypothetical protein